MSNLPPPPPGNPDGPPSYPPPAGPPPGQWTPPPAGPPPAGPAPAGPPSGQWAPPPAAPPSGQWAPPPEGQWAQQTPAGPWAPPPPPGARAPLSEAAKKLGWFMIGAGALGAIAAVLPWISLSGPGADSVKEAMEAQGEGLGGLDKDGALTIILAIVVVVMGALRLCGKAAKAGPITGIVMGALVALISVIDIADVNSITSEPVFRFVDVEPAVGIGLWLTLVAGIMMVVASVLALRSNSKS